LSTSRAVRSAAAVALALAWSAARPAVAQAPSSLFGETVEVRVVNLEVEVTDPDGFPVTGLGPDDIRLVVDGEPVEIRYFTEIRSGTAIAPGGGKPSPVAGVPSLEPGEPVGTSYLVFIDDYFSIARDRDRVLEALREQVALLKPEDRMAIVAWDGEVTMLSSWSQSTRDLDRVLRGAQRRKAGGLARRSELRIRGGPSGAEFAPFESAPRGLGERLDVAQISYALRLQEQLETAIDAVSAVLRAFARPPGRKVLLLLSGGWPWDLEQYVSGQYFSGVRDRRLRDGQEIFAPLVDTANQVGYTIFPIDVPGMEGSELGDVTQGRLARTSASAGDSAFARESTRHFALERVAYATGGSALLNAERLDALTEAERATRTYYWIGFTPEWRGDDRRHRVEVSTVAEGLRARARSSYVDFSRDTELAGEVESILLFGSANGTRPLRVDVGEPRRVSRRVMHVPLAIGLPFDELTSLPGPEGGRAAQLQVRFAAIDEDGGRSEVPVYEVRFDVPETPGPGALARYRTTLELRRKHNRLVVAVYDPLQDATWSATVDIQP